MGRRALIIALAAFAVIALGAVITWAIVVSSAPPSAGPEPDPTDPVAQPVVTEQPEPSETPSETPVPQPTGPASDPAPAAVTALAAKPAPHSVRLDWTNPADDDLHQLVVVQKPGATPPPDPASGTTLGTVSAGQTSFVDKSPGLKPGQQFSYSVFARDTAGTLSAASGLTVTLPAAITVTPVDVTGAVTQTTADATLTDTGSLAFTAYTVANPRIAVVLPASGVIGTMGRTLTEPKGSAPGAVAWTYSVASSAIRFLGEGEKRDEVFVIELREGADKVPTTVTVQAIGINDAPVASAQAAQAAIAGSAFSYPLPPGAFTDPDASDVLTVTAASLPAWLSFDGVTLSGTPSAGDVGTTTVTVTATDPHGASASSDVVVEVSPAMPAPNQAPVPVTDEVTFDLALDPLQTSAELLANDTDPDGGPNPLAVLPASGEWQVGGEVAGAFTIDAAGTLHLDSGVVADGPLQRLADGEQATATLTYEVTDGADTSSAQVNVTVLGASASKARYDVTKVMVPPLREPARGLGIRPGIG